MTKKLLLTGGAGFIGINTADYFLTSGWQVIIFDNFSRDRVAENIDWLKSAHQKNLEVIKADVVTDTAKLKELTEQVDLVIHLAAQVAVTTSVADPIADFQTNALGTLNVLEAIRKSNKKPALIYSSTNKVYGDLENIKTIEKELRYEFADIKGVTEQQNLDFHSPYGCSKGTADQYIRDYSRIYGLKTVVFRQSCIYGPHQFGIEDQGWVAWFIIATLLNKKISIYGTGKQVRDVLYINDLVKAYDQAFQNIDKTAGQIYNIGGGYDNSLSLLEFLSILEKLLGKKIKYSFADWRPGDQKMFISDNTKLLHDLGWQPQISKESGITKITTWLKENINSLN